MIKRVYSLIRTRGVGVLFGVLYRRVFRPRFARFQQCAPFFLDRRGLEIGGPSSVFDRRGLFPVYPLAARVDNCNFGDVTVWEGAIQQGATFQYDNQRAPGIQYIAEATDLGVIAAGSYDFVLSSHALEHVANPLQALSEWKRVLKDDAVLALILPHRDGTFDHRRPVTALSHLIDDFERNTGEDDLTHLDEILALHDLAMDPQSGGGASFKARSMKNIENRCLHHHVFDTRLAVELVDHMGFQIIAVEGHHPFHIFILAQKPSPGVLVQNEAFTGPSQTPRATPRQI